ncbi:phosphoserine phosphatase-like [Acanthaster planci]|uniref:Phosphoserine phosphatase n=1 Tax=Acanthaster planci TaxID=133434 RepID=A0A8B7YKS1_ACAPL|nr:phosphoserine phosphatase-like [Acanthaster planci]XP_022093228.1 phosphoserine phosphatase-like [Acanthaster planci]
MATMEETKDIWRKADAVCFDVDSTVSTEEAIDELAAHCGVGQEVAQWTKKAMDGSITYKETLEARMTIIHPTMDQVKAFIDDHPPAKYLTPGVTELIQLLHARGTAVYLVTGGFFCTVVELAKALQIPEENIFANRMKFYYSGDFAGFCEEQPTCEAGGKPKVVGSLKQKHGYQNLVMIGDGATDLEACPPADAFIGFGGNKIRPKVQECAQWFVSSFQELINALNESS